jgi:transposase InsO family protein
LTGVAPSITSGATTLHAYEDAREAREGIIRYFEFYDEQRPHQALGYQTPGAFHRAGLREVLAA